MKETDYVGLSHFQEFCKDLDEHYVVVGGFATLMLLDNEITNHGKATYDIDLVLLSSNSKEITQRIKQYVKEGEYKIQTGSTDQYQYYRFIEPKKENFAKEIELFASNENMLELDENQRIIPIDPEEGLYSLSAIMLDKEYFEMIKNNIDKNHVAPCTNTQATILLKMSAFYDLEQDVDSNKKIASPGADRGTRTPTDCSIRTSSVRVYQFHHICIFYHLKVACLPFHHIRIEKIDRNYIYFFLSLSIFVFIFYIMFCMVN